MKLVIKKWEQGQKYMKKIITGLALGWALIGSVEAQIISQWTFESLTSISAGTTTGLLPAEVGSGNASVVHASSSTYSILAGDFTPKSLSSNTWAVGDYYQFQASTIGFSNIHLIWDQTSSGTGPRDFSLQYSTDGTSFTPFGSVYQVPNNASPNVWSASGPYVSAAEFAFDLSSVTSINNKASVYFRLVDNSITSANAGTVAPGGTNRVDAFTISQGFVSIAPVPEPHEYAIAIAGLLGVVIVMRRRKKAAMIF